MRKSDRCDKTVIVNDLCHKGIDANRETPKHKSHILQWRKYTVSLKTSVGLHQTDLRRVGNSRKKIFYFVCNNRLRFKKRNR
jgi:hypothetical protein